MRIQGICFGKPAPKISVQTKIISQNFCPKPKIKIGMFGFGRKIGTKMCQKQGRMVGGYGLEFRHRGSGFRVQGLGQAAHPLGLGFMV